MPVREPSQSEAPSTVDKERRLQTYIQKHIDKVASGDLEPAEILVIARSTASPLFRALEGSTEAMAANGIGVRIIVVGTSATPRSLDVLATRTPVTLRNASASRFADAHEQLVLDKATCWYGDSMRRDPTRRDSYEAYHDGDAEIARLAHLSFSRLWEGALPVTAQGSRYAS